MIRDWLEQQNWYWYSLSISFYPFPWHWQVEYENHPGWWKLLVGPVGIMIVKPHKERTK